MLLTLLEARDLTVYRGDELLFETVSLTVSMGEMLQIAGSNGSGKTTLLRVLCGLVPPDDGEVLWQGRALGAERGDFYQQVLFLGHKPGIKYELSAVENLAVAQSLVGPVQRRTIDDALSAVCLSERAELPCGVLSAGQRRRVALARLLLRPTPLWILDEPLTALDTDGRELVQSLLAQQVQGGGSVLYTTHQPLLVPGVDVRTLRLGS